MSEYTKEQEAEALRAVHNSLIEYKYNGFNLLRVPDVETVLAMAKRTAEAEARLEVSRFERDALKARVAELDRSLSEADNDRAAIRDMLVSAEAERDAIKARVVELEAKAAPPPVVVTREMVEALHDYVVHTGADWSAHHERLVGALRKVLEVKP